MNTRDEIHRRLDGEAVERPARESDRLQSRYEDALSRLADCRAKAPAELTDRILAALPEAPPARRAAVTRGFGWLRPAWPGRRTWLAPALAGALAAFVLAVLVTPRLGGPRPDRTAVHFEVHAPGAHRVELVGTFNDWTPGTVVLDGPDATGHWSATVELPAGRYEYLFLVDGTRWVTDPTAPAHRPDGFGRRNALIEL